MKNKKQDDYINPHQRKVLEELFIDVIKEQNEKKQLINNINLIGSMIAILFLVDIVIFIVSLIERNIILCYISYVILIFIFVLAEIYNENKFKLYKEYKEEIK